MTAKIESAEEFAKRWHYGSITSNGLRLAVEARDEQIRADERERAASIVGALIASHDQPDETGYVIGCAKEGAFCECFGISNLREILAEIERRGHNNKGGAE